MTARRVPTVTAAIQVPRHIKDDPEVLGVTHVSRASCLSTSTVPGIIKALAAEGFWVEVGKTRRNRGRAAADPRYPVARGRRALLSKESRVRVPDGSPKSKDFGSALSGWRTRIP